MLFFLFIILTPTATITRAEANIITWASLPVLTKDLYIVIRLLGESLAINSKLIS